MLKPRRQSSIIRA